MRRTRTRNVFGAALFATAFAAALVPASAAHAATVTVVNLDGAGEGFNDNTSVSPVGGNDGTTLGQQRLNVFDFAASLLSARLVSDVEILVDSNFDPLTCGLTSAILGSAGTQTVHRDFVGAQLSATYYPQALANALAGSDLAPSNSDIRATFNSSIGTTCSFPNTWYYGLDGTPPPGKIDLATVVLHEISHGLGFAAFVNLPTGQKFGGLDDVFMFNLEDHGTGKIYPDMSDGERVAASTSSDDLHWVGPTVVAGSGDLISGAHASGHVEMYAPNPAQQGSSVSHYSTALAPNELMEPSYTGANHNLERTLELFTDLGWQLVVAPSVACGDANEDTNVSTTDALQALNTSVGTQNCVVEVCDVNSTMAVTATDALLIVQYAVGQPVELTCP